MANKEIVPIVDMEAGPSTSVAAGTSDRSTTPPLTIAQELVMLKKEFCQLKQRYKVGDKSMLFSWEAIPGYNPGKSDISINKWIRLVEERAYFLRWDDVTTTRFVISKLEGRAREWYLAGEFAHKSWIQLKTALRFTFDVDASATGLLFQDAANFSSDRHNSLAEYFEEKLRKIHRLNWEIPEQEKVNIIVHGIREKDIKQMALANKYQNTDELLTYLRGCDLNSDSKYPLKQNFTSDFKIQCFNCKESGHRSFNCPRKRVPGEKSRRLNVRCNFCKLPGHYEKECRKKRSVNNKQNA